ncbi:hypothetical protein IE81DRAFT_367046 [Ceraceosorus guamensis]|uniref:Amino acid transporter transmembrane domain-containing protein n=1 Tax=Ceraceosorus guamensis TaxID=1522189 RepID=A0A316VWZ7_9BASI|nr:hypothetical protein IE81DRAFT_367046 [Ceraceosorus guamensis]PWN42000.1 hypothetical protein IE81DRAFT_367046 [Ceraceosorus guamensis]
MSGPGGDSSDSAPSGARPVALRARSSSSANQDAPFGLARSPVIPNIPPRGEASNVQSPRLGATELTNPIESESGVTVRGGRASSSVHGSRPNSTAVSENETTPVNLADLDSLPISDEQKAKIIDRHLVRPDASGFPRIDTNTTDASAASDAAGPSHQVRFPGYSSGDETDTEEYLGPATMQGGAITDDVYRWAHKNRRQSAKRTRSESLHLPRTSTIDPDLDASAIREPGGFRRFFVLTQAGEQGRPPPRALRSFIDFLALYGHYGGEDLEDIDEEDDDDGDELDDEQLRAEEARELGRPSGSHGEPTERTALLTRRASRRALQRSNSRIRRGSEGGRPRGEATETEAVLMLLKSFVGTGILFLGKAFMNGGLLFSTIVLCAVAMISLVSFLLLVKANLKYPASFGDMGGILYGPKMRLAILTSIVFSQFGFVAAYTVFVAQNLQAFVLAVTHCRTLVPTVWLILAQALIFLPLSLVRRIAKLSSTALVADVFILFGIIYLFKYEITELVEKGVADVVQFNSSTFSLFIGTAVFTFEGVGLVIPITESMKEPEKFPRALSGVMAGTMVLFTASGALSYMAFGSKVQTVVITNLPQNSKFVQAMQFLYSVAILLSTPLQLFPAVSILERGIFTAKSGKYNWKIKFWKNVFRCSTVVLCSFAAWAGSASLDVFVSFIGSVACVPLCFIYPPLLHLRACATSRKDKILDYAILAFGIACTLFAGSQTVYTLINPSSPPDQPVCTPP